jgi:hypothetical protein
MIGHGWACVARMKSGEGMAQAFPDCIRATRPCSPLPLAGEGSAFDLHRRQLKLDRSAAAFALSRPSGTLGFGILRRPTSCIHAVVSHEWERVSRRPLRGRF